MSNEVKNGNDEMTRVGIVLFIGLLLVTFLPVLICSAIFAYIVYASFNEKEERKWIRSGFFVLCGFFITDGVWNFVKKVLPQILAGHALQQKMAKIMLIPMVQNEQLFYFIFLPIGFYLLHTSLKPSLAPYEWLHKISFKLFWPFRIIKAIAIGIYAVFFSSITETKDIQKNSLLFKLVFLIGSVFATGFFLAGAGYFTDKSAAREFFAPMILSYVIFYWYSYFAHKTEDEPQGINYIQNMKVKNGLEVGRLVHPKKMPLQLTWRDINHHIHILGQPGAGKSVLLKNIYAHQILSGAGLLMVDLKADIDVRRDFMSLAVHSGRQKDFISIDLSNPESSYGYNPLLIGNATELKDKIIGAIEWSEPYYKKVSERVLLTVLRGFVWLRERGNIPTLEDLYVAISSVPGLSLLAEQVDDEFIKADINQLIVGFAKDLSKDLEGLKTDIALLVQSEFGKIFLKRNSLNILQAIYERKIVLVNLDGQTYNESAKRFGRLLLADLRAASGQLVTRFTKEERPTFTVIIDEFADIVSTEDMARTFVSFLNRCRGSGIGVVIAHQSLGDFKEATVKSQIMDSTETLFSFVQKDPDTCETLASIVGTKEVWSKTEQTSESMFSNETTGMGTRKLVHEYVYHPNQFKNLGTGVAIYAAKKPSRHGIVQVKMLEIPHLDEATTAAVMQQEELSQGENSLGLSRKLNTRQRNFQDSLRQENNNDVLEI